MARNERYRPPPSLVKEGVFSLQSGVNYPHRVFTAVLGMIKLQYDRNNNNFSGQFIRFYIKEVDKTEIR